MAEKQHNMVVRRGTVTIVGADDTTTAGTSTQEMNGLVRWVDFTTANMQDSDSTNIVVVDEFGGTVYASGTVAESTTFSNGTTFPVYGTVDVVAVAEGTQSASREVPFGIILEE